MLYSLNPADLGGFNLTDPDPSTPEIRMVGEAWSPPGRPIGPHQHGAAWECYLQRSGRTRWWVDGSVHDIGPGDGYLIPPGREHALTGSIDGERHHFVWAILDLDAIATRRPELALSWPDQAYVGRLHGLADPLRCLLDQAREWRPRRSVGLRCASDLVAMSLSQIEAEPPAPITTDSLMERVCNVMLADPGRAWRNPDLAAVAHLGVNQLLRRFRRATGLSPRQWLITERLRRVANSLTHDSASITVIAHELGFSSSQHLATAFKGRYGVSPARWRAGDRQPADPIEPLETER